MKTGEVREGNMGSKTVGPNAWKLVVVAAWLALPLVSTQSLIAGPVPGAIIWWGFQVPANSPPNDLTNVISVTPNMALTADGNLTVWGNNSFGQCNIPLELASNAIAIAEGHVHRLALKNADAGAYDVVVSNAYGSVTSSNVMLNVVDLAYALNATNLVWANDSDVPWFAEVEESEDGVAAAKCDGVMDNQVSILETTVTGPGTLSFWWEFEAYVAAPSLSFSINGVEQATIQGPVWVPWQQHTYYLPAGSHILRWTFAGVSRESNGYNSAWLDQVSYLAGSAMPVIVVPPADVIQAGGGNATFSVMAVGTPPLNYQWQFNGTNIVGATNAWLILTNVRAADQGDYAVVVDNACGSVVSSNATLTVVPSLVVVWGNNNYGQTNVPVGLTNAVSIAAGAFHCMALKNDRTVVVWGGDDYYGQTNVPMGLSNVVAIAAGRTHSLALGNNGNVVAWGNNGAGQTNVPSGLSNVVAVAGGGSFSLALKSDGTVITWGNYTEATNVPPGLSNVVAIAAGYDHCLALKSDETVVAWGYNFDGRATVPAGLSNVVGIAAGYSHSLALKSDGTVVAWGTSYYGMSGPVTPPDDLSNVVAIAAGGEYFGVHSLALRSDGTVVAWGYNCCGQTNLPPGLTNVTAIAAGGDNSLVIQDTHPPVLHASLLNPTLNSNGFTLSLPTQSGRVYGLEYKSSLTDSNWTALPLVAGNGGNLSLIDSTAASSQRFYRVRRW